MKDYSYIIMLLPGLFVLRALVAHRAHRASALPVLGVLLLVQAADTQVPLLRQLMPLIHAYFPLLLTGAVGVYLLRIALPSPDGVPIGLTPHPTPQAQGGNQ
jgi:hypothetical protein